VKRVALLFAVAVVCAILGVTVEQISPTCSPVPPEKMIVIDDGPFVYNSRVIYTEIMDNEKTGYHWLMNATDYDQHCDYINRLDSTAICMRRLAACGQTGAVLHLPIIFGG
jgi:hypothetical protein